MIAFISDVHVGNPKKLGGTPIVGVNTRGRLVLDTLKRATDEAQRLGARELVVLGDLFDSVLPEPQLVVEVQKIFGATRFPGIFILKGNHEMVTESIGDHSLGPLAALDAVHVIETVEELDFGRCLALALPFSTMQGIDYVRQALAAYAPSSPGAVPRILLMHLGIETPSTPPFLKGARDSIRADVLADLMKEYGFLWAFAGNWHNHQVVGSIVQVGTLCPTGWNNPGLDGYGKLVLLDDNLDIAVKEIPGPRFVKTFTPADVQRALKVASQGFAVYVEDATGSAIDHQGLAHVAPILDAEETRSAARTAASVARHATTLETALAGYVEAMPLAEGVDRASVLARARRFLGV